MLLCNLQPTFQHVMQKDFLLENGSAARKAAKGIRHKLDSSIRIKTHINTVQAVHVGTALHDVSPHAFFCLISTFNCDNLTIDVNESVSKS